MVLSFTFSFFFRGIDNFLWTCKIRRFGPRGSGNDDDDAREIQKAAVDVSFWACE